MGIKKADLYKFVEGKFMARKAPIFEAIKAELKKEAFVLLSAKYPELDAVERQAQRFYDEVQTLRTKYASLGSLWNLSRTSQHVNDYVIGMGAQLADDQAGYATQNILKNTTNGLMPELEKIMPAFKAKYLVEITEYKQLCKLSYELLPIIDGCRTGDKAYAKLQELGVDLTGFDTGTPNLPAVIKLTVDVKLLNGDC